MASLTVENYLKAIYQICLSAPGKPAATGELAGALRVSPGTVTSMLKTLSETGLASYTPYGGVQLTPAGNGLALRVLRRHRLIELFLVKTLNLSWDEVHEEAEHMEHAVSDLLIDRIEAFLGHPKVDPHGDPIPQADGSLDVQLSRTLAACAPGEEFQLVRVLDQSPEFLRFLTESKLSLGAQGRVTSNRPEAGVITIAVSGRELTLGCPAAAKILVAATSAP
ncbi:MAG TPA: metal-dependent transcriptional regulator [Pirellulales bacterium]|nr:metal-dependent transcriptional regulator [Pirellulales bacterium]